MRRRAPDGTWRLLAAVAAVAAGVTLGARQAPSTRLVDSRDGREVALAAVAGQASDVLILGVPLDSPGAHRALPAVLEVIARGRDETTLALEVLDRQAQEAFDHFQMGHSGEAEFLAGVARAWPAYARDYKPIVDAAMARGWSIVAAAMPLPVADAVADRGRAALADLPAGERAFVAAADACDGYGGPGVRLPARPFSGLSWCLENETLAESVAQAHAASAIGGKRPVVVAVVQRARLGHLTRLVGDVMRRMPGRTITAIAVRPVDRPEAVPIEADDLSVPRYQLYVAP